MERGKPASDKRSCSASRNQHVLKRGALLADLHIAVAIGTLEVVVALDPPSVVALVGIDGFFRKNQHAAGLKRVVKPLE